MFKLHPEDVAIWDVVRNDWTVVNGQYTVMVGASSADIRLKGTFNV